MTLVDVHAHFLTDRYVREVEVAVHSRSSGGATRRPWSVEEHLTFMDAHDVTRSMLSISSPGVFFGDGDAASALARHVNDAGAALVAAHPGRFGHFASLPLPDIEAARQEAIRALDELGSDGVTIENNAHGRYLGDDDFAPLYAELDRRAAVVFVHPISPPPAPAGPGRVHPGLEFTFDTTRTVADLAVRGVLERYPRIRWLFTHGGGAVPLIAGRVEVVRAAIAGRLEQLGGLWFDMAGTPFPDQALAVVAAFGADRIVYGSDYGSTPAEQLSTHIASIDSAAPPPTAGTWRELTTRNFGRLLARPA